MDCYGDISSFGKIAIINVEYAPLTQCIVGAFGGTNNTNNLSVNNAGEIYAIQVNSNSTKRVVSSITYPKKGKLT